MIQIVTKKKKREKKEREREKGERASRPPSPPLCVALPSPTPTPLDDKLRRPRPHIIALPRAHPPSSSLLWSLSELNQVWAPSSPLLPSTLQVSPILLWLPYSSPTYTTLLPSFNFSLPWGIQKSNFTVGFFFRNSSFSLFNFFATILGTQLISAHMRLILCDSNFICVIPYLIGQLRFPLHLI